MTPILINTDYLLYLADEDDKTTGGLYDELTESYVSDATVTAKLYQDSTQIGDTISMSYVASTDGVYRGVIPASTTSTLSPNVRYTIRFYATASGNNFEQWENVHAEHHKN